MGHQALRETAAPTDEPLSAACPFILQCFVRSGGVYTRLYLWGFIPARPGCPYIEIVQVWLCCSEAFDIHNRVLEERCAC